MLTFVCWLASRKLIRTTFFFLLLNRPTTHFQCTNHIRSICSLIIYVRINARKIAFSSRSWTAVWFVPTVANNLIRKYTNDFNCVIESNVAAQKRITKMFMNCVVANDQTNNKLKPNQWYWFVRLWAITQSGEVEWRKANSFAALIDVAM